MSLKKDVEEEIKEVLISEEEIKNNIVEYIGGTKTNGEQLPGELGTGEDVIGGNVDFAARKIEEINDIETLYLDTSSNPTSNTNITIADSNEATIDHSNITVTIN